MSEQRPMRICDLCGAVDDHPRHVIAYPPGGYNRAADFAAKAMKGAGDSGELIFAQLKDDTTSMRHMDCCREAGCPDGTCDEVTAGAEDKRGDALVKHLTKEN